MRLTFLFGIVCSLAMSTTRATQYGSSSKPAHSGCYNYFLGKDGCVVNSAENPCPTNGSVTPGRTSTSIHPFHLGSPSDSSGSLPPTRLARRYDTTIPTKAIAGGTGICGRYNSTAVSGVCLWSGRNWVDGSNPEDSGWLNGAETRNCGKTVFVQRQGQPETVQYAPILDGCNYLTKDPAVGCFQVWLTIDLFDKFGPTKAERDNFTIDATFTWDFVKADANVPNNGPV